MNDSENFLPGQAYSRLFKGGRHPSFDEQPLKELAEAMGIGELLNLDGTPAGIVYFGQFIDHDLTRDQTKLSDAGNQPPEKTRNFRTARFDLDSLYGKGPEGELADPSVAPEDYLYDHSKPGCERFRLGRIDPPVPGSPATAPLSRSDLPRRHDLTAVIADDRNDENLIIAQLTMIFLKFHNRLLDLLELDKPLIQHAGGKTLFDKARRLVIWHYQYIVVHEFVDKIVLNDVSNKVFEGSYTPRLFCPHPGQLIDLPVEFAMAAFRFGHSMVRNTYRLHAGSEKELAALLRREARRLTADEVVDWDLFFGSRGTGTNLALRIDTKLAGALTRLPPNVVRLFTGCAPSEILSLPARTLLRGSRAGLPSAQEACCQAEIPFVDFREGERHYDILKQHGMNVHTPLWYYVLHEAWIAGSDFPEPVQLRKSGLRLGPLGSLIVAEVILGLLTADRSSFLHASPGWRPPVPELIYMPSGKLAAITDMDHLVRFALTSER